MTIDFGRAWFGASVEQQRAEVVELRRKLQARAEVQARGVCGNS